VEINASESLNTSLQWLQFYQALPNDPFPRNGMGGIGTGYTTKRADGI
jgi:hypothetical protein